MTLRLHEAAGNWFVVVTQLLMLMLLSVSNIAYGFALGMTAAGLLGLFGWSAASRRVRIVEDSVRSKIASAAQGYVELVGVAEPTPGEPLRDPVTEAACVWYRVETHSNQGGGWVIERTCPHRQADLKVFGEIEGDELVCTLHGWRFDLATGRCRNADDRSLRVRRLVGPGLRERPAGACRAVDPVARFRGGVVAPGEADRRIRHRRDRKARGGGRNIRR